MCTSHRNLACRLMRRNTPLLLAAPLALLLAAQTVGQDPDSGLKQLEMQQKVIDQQFSLLRNTRADLRNQTVAIENGWMSGELTEFHQLHFLRSKQLRDATQLKSACEVQREQLLRFVQGQRTPLSVIKFCKSIHELEQDAGTKELLQREVSSISARDFERRYPQFSLVNPDGSLMRAPLVRCGTNVYDLHPAEFETCWRDVVSSIIGGGSPSPQQLSQLYATWEASKSKAYWTSVAASRPDQARIMAYFYSLKNLTSALQNPQQTTTLRAYLDHSVFEFPGGTVADLVEHLLKHQLSVRYGSSPQLILSELSREMVRNLDNQVALLSTRIEQLKSQSPAHDAALKRRVAASAQSTDSEFDSIQPSSSTSGASSGGGNSSSTSETQNSTQQSSDSDNSQDGQSTTGQVDPATAQSNARPTTALTVSARSAKPSLGISAGKSLSRSPTNVASQVARTVKSR